MVYGMILLEHTKWKSMEQRVGIQAFAKKIGLKIDKILSYTEKPDFSGIKNNDTIIFYDWNCICNSRKDISKYVEQFVKNHIEDKKIQIISLWGLIPVMKIVHKLKLVEETKWKFAILSKMFWLFGFVPLFLTKRDCE